MDFRLVQSLLFFSPLFYLVHPFLDRDLFKWCEFPCHLHSYHHHVYSFPFEVAVITTSYPFSFKVAVIIHFWAHGLLRRNTWLTNEMIHNPMVNKRLEDMDVQTIPLNDGKKEFEIVGEGDVVVLPAFGAAVDEMRILSEKNVQIVDTT